MIEWGRKRNSVKKGKTFPNTKQKVGSKTCGPSCLLNIYQHFGRKTSLATILKELGVKNDESTHLPQLARHLNRNRLKTVILSSCAHNISPNWATKNKKEVIELLKKWVTHNSKDKWLADALHLLFYLQEGGEVKLVDLTTKVIDGHLAKSDVVLSCLEESWLWGKRKISGTAKFDNIRGHTEGHFVVVYDRRGSDYLVSDPFPTGLKGKEGLYAVDKEKLLVSTLIWGAQVLAIKGK
jgi:hypothetical protein